WYNRGSHPPGRRQRTRRFPRDAPAAGRPGRPDAQTYRDPDEVKHYRETRDCLKQFRERTCHAGLLSASDLDAIDAEVEARIEDAVQRAKNDPKPEPDDLLRDVYVSYP
ncbi:thiamine pyrophosphate-dependent enzyme, partial [Pseudomonas aeruginosa]|nr:thiamine pyrophosphate-dependent enzyme [Pseudomonas aeruginosa]